MLEVFERAVLAKQPVYPSPEEAVRTLRVLAAPTGRGKVVAVKGGI